MEKGGKERGEGGMEGRREREAPYKGYPLRLKKMSFLLGEMSSFQRVKCVVFVILGPCRCGLTRKRFCSIPRHTYIHVLYYYALNETTTGVAVKHDYPTPSGSRPHLLKVGSLLL